MAEQRRHGHRIDWPLPMMGTPYGADMETPAGDYVLEYALPEN